jgi:hypothetical protein
VTEHQISFLFPIEGDHFTEQSIESDDVQVNRNLGSAGHYLAIADLKIRGYDAGDIDGVDTDVVAEIDGRLWRFQVKSSTEAGNFGKTQPPRTGHRGGCRPLWSYGGKIDAFAFVFLPRRAVYYCHVNAIGDRNSITIATWSLQACDLSFVELLRRFRGEAP